MVNNLLISIPSGEIPDGIVFSLFEIEALAEDGAGGEEEARALE